MLVAQAEVGRPGWSVCVVGVAELVVPDVRFGAISPAFVGGLAVLIHVLCKEALQTEADLIVRPARERKKKRQRGKEAKRKRGRSDN